MPGPAEETPKHGCGKTLTDFSPELQDAQTPETRKARSFMELEGLDQEFELEAEAMPEGESGEVESAAEPASSKPVRVKPVINDEKNEKDALYWKLPS